MLPVKLKFPPKKGTAYFSDKFQWFSSILCGLAPMEKDIRYIRSAIEDIACTNRSSRESDKVGRRVCIEHDFAKEWEIRINTGTEASVVGIGNKRAELRSHREGR